MASALTKTPDYPEKLPRLVSQKFSLTALYEHAKARAEARANEESKRDVILASLDQHLKNPRNLAETLAVFIAANREKIAGRIEQHYKLATEREEDENTFERLVVNKFIFPEFAAQVKFEDADAFNLKNWQTDKTALGNFLTDTLNDFFEELYPLFFKKKRLYLTSDIDGAYLTKKKCPTSLDALKHLGWEIPVPLTLATLQNSLRQMADKLQVSDEKKKAFIELVDDLGVHIYLKAQNNEENDDEEEDDDEEQEDEFDSGSGFDEEEDEEGNDETEPEKYITVHDPVAIQEALTGLIRRLIDSQRLSTLGNEGETLELPALSSLDDLHLTVEKYENLGRELEVALIRKGLQLRVQGASTDSQISEDIYLLSEAITGGYEAVGRELNNYDKVGKRVKKIAKNIGFATLVLALTYVAQDHLADWIRYIAYIFAGWELLDSGRRALKPGQGAIREEYLSENTATGVENYLKVAQGALELKRLREAAYEESGSAEREKQAKILREAESMLVEELKREAPNLEEQLIKPLEPGEIREDVRLRIGGVESGDAAKETLEATQALLEDLALEEAAKEEADAIVKRR